MDRCSSVTPLQGAMTALVTPFREGEVDWACLDALVDRQIEGGTDWLVACGTTAETPTLTHSERAKMIDAVIARAGDRCRVMVGTGSNNTVVTVSQTREAAAAGAGAVLVVAPYYNCPTGEGLFRHFAKVAESVDLPIVLYNVPKRTGVSISNEVVARLRRAFPHIAALKHATGSVDGVTELLGLCDIAVLSGDDALTWPLMSVGAVGVISVISNLAPSLIKSQIVAGLAGDCAAARLYHRKVCDFAVAIGRFGPNPIPIKTAMAINGLLKEEFRLPLCPVDGDVRAELERVLRRHELAELSSR